MTLRSFSIHGHFYQPPREDPITGKIPNEVGSNPYKNWNEKIYAECYRPNAELGNFERISFNVGPTLCEWMHEHHVETCQRIVAQDQANVRRFGIGNAMAQAYNHTILPLASYQDKVTQVAWGIADFEHRFGRKPQGMWLPETGADQETLSVLAEHGIEFTILAPWQAEGPAVDPTEAYRVPLPHGRQITVFFYHADLSSRISFDPGSTSNADVFINYLLKPHFNAEKLHQQQPQILLLASDGELYGHHQHFRDRFLAHMVNGASTAADLSPVFPARWLRDNPPRRTIGIRDNTSWSCHHGVMRWMGECGCASGDGVWKAYLRRGLDHLAQALNTEYERAASRVVPDPWELLSHYIQVILGNRTAADLIHEHARRSLTEETVARIALLLRSQYERQRMFTSCGWFFEDFSRIEPKNNVAYAAQAVRLVRQATGVDLAPLVTNELQHVISHRTGLRGDVVFRRQLQRAEEYAGTNSILTA